MDFYFLGPPIGKEGIANPPFPASSSPILCVLCADLEFFAIK